MNYEKCCGAVIYTKINGEIFYILVSNLRGIYGFPKGHMEDSETETETALREVYEETHLRIRIIDGFRTTEIRNVPYKQNTFKEIVYFLGTYSNQSFSYQKEELTGAYCVSFSQALSLLQMESSKHILREANDFLLGVSKDCGE